MERTNLLPKIDWVTKSQNGFKGKTDVSIRISNESVVTRYVNFSLRNGVFELISSTDYIVIGVLKNRIFFKGSDAKNGFTLKSRQGQDEGKAYFKISDANTIEHCAPFEGDYELKYDEFYGLYYIENNEMNKKDGE